MPEKTHQGRNHKSTWTVKDIRFVEQHYGRRSVEEIAGVLVEVSVRCEELLISQG